MFNYQLLPLLLVKKKKKKKADSLISGRWMMHTLTYVILKLGSLC